MALLLLAGCGGSDNENNNTGAAESSILLYYVNDDWTGFSPENIDEDQLATVENRIDTVITEFLEGGGTSSMQSPVPYGMTYQRYTYDDRDTVNLVFTVDWESSDEYRVVLCKAAFVRTLCQLEGVDTVTYELVDIVDSTNVVKEEYTESSYADIGDILASESEQDIYMPDSMGQKLVKKTIVIDRSSAKSVETQVLDALVREYEGTVTPFGGRTAVKNVEVDDGVCTVTFNEYFAMGKTGVDNEIAVYSIVDSLVEIDGIRRVKLTIDGADDMLGDVSLADSMAGNYIYVEN